MPFVEEEFHMAFELKITSLFLNNLKASTWNYFLFIQRFPQSIYGLEIQSQERGRRETFQISMVSFIICLSYSEIILDMEWGKCGHTHSVEVAAFNTLNH